MKRFRTIQPSCAGSVKDPPVLLFPEDRPSRLSASVCTLQVYLVDLIPFLITHVSETKYARMSTCILLLL